MKLSTRGRYATRALLDLACHQEGAPIPLKDIARRQGISLYYLEHIVMPLATAGMVRSLRGTSGGIQLARPPREIRLSGVLRLAEGSLVPVECVANPEICSRSRLCVTREICSTQISRLCVTREIWVELDRAMRAVLESTTLQDLVERQERKERAIGLDMEEIGRGKVNGRLNQ